jgi:hypothetical protein
MDTNEPPKKTTPTKKDLLRARDRLLSLMNSEPSAAIVEARALPADDYNWRSLRALVLCDAGISAGDAAAVAEAVAIFFELHRAAPMDGGLAYNLANAIAGQA